jgi:hypothetical protein
MRESSSPQVFHQRDHDDVRDVVIGGEVEPDIPVRMEEVAERALALADPDRLDDYGRVCCVRDLDRSVGVCRDDTEDEPAWLAGTR